MLLIGLALRALALALALAGALLIRRGLIDLKGEPNR